MNLVLRDSDLWLPFRLLRALHERLRTLQTHKERRWSIETFATPLLSLHHMNLGIDTIILFTSIKRNDHWSRFARNENFHPNSENIHCLGTRFAIFVLHITLGHLLGRFVGKFEEILICLIFYVTKANHANEIITS